MNKSDLIENVAVRTNLTKKEAVLAVNAVFATIEEALVAGDSVRLVGFGTFETRERKARTGRNPQVPGEFVEIPASKAPAFKAGKSFKDAVNK